MSKKIPIRTCIVTREKYPKNDLIRIVKNNKNEIFVDMTQKQNGRGVYIKKDLEVLEKAIKTKILEKHLEMPIENSIYEQIKQIIIKND